MTRSAQEPVPDPPVRTAPGVAAPTRGPEPSKPSHVATLEPPHDDHAADEPGYGHGV